MTETLALAFDAPNLLGCLESLEDSEIDWLEYGVIGIDADHVVRRYSARESEMAGLAVDKVLGKPFFTHVAGCMNNFLVAQRFVDSAESGACLDETIDYVLTFRMRPVKVKLRLMASPGAALGYVLVNRVGRPL